MKSLLAALGFLTIFPLPGRWRVKPEHLARATPWFPTVGLLIGAVLALADLALGGLTTPPIRNALLVLLMVVLSGALHLDGLMDTCDGALATVSAERRLEIMRDSHVGSFGVAGAGLLLLGKFAALESLQDAPRGAALVLMAVLGRWAMSLAITRFPSGRADGLGHLVKQAARPSDLWLAGGSTALLAALTLQASGLLLALGCTLLTCWLARSLLTRLSGLTGDSYGAIDELVELAALALLPPCLRLAGWLANVL